MERTDQQQQISGTTLYGIGFKSMIKKKSLKQNVHGFTLLELLLYVAMVTIILSALIPFTWDIIGSSVKSKVQQEVSANGRYVTERINYEIRNAAGINSVSASSISLSETNAAVNPTVIDSSGGNVRIKQGAAAAVNLNSDDTTVSSLTFTNYTSADNKTKHIQTVITIGSNFNQKRQEYKQTMTLETSAELRSIP